MRIVVLDGQTLNPGDLSWSDLESLGNVDVYPRTTLQELHDRASCARCLITNKVPLTRETLEKLEGLKYIGVTATGYNIVDVEACRDRGITLTNVPAYSSASVAQLVFAFILEHCHNVGLHAGLVRSGQWSTAKDFSFWERPLVELEGRTLAIIGFGNIGRRVARIGSAFGMRVLVNSRTRISEPGVEWRDFPDILAEADFVTLHCPLTPETQGMINRQTLHLMKREAFLVNTGRGQLVVEEDLADHLAKGNLAGAGLDVLSAEPPSASNPLLHVKNAFITPHIAWATKAARERLMKASVQNLRNYLEGKPTNVVC